MSGYRNADSRWHQEVPGARWFKADLHLHTIDDHPGGLAKWPDGLNADPSNLEALQAYARRYLQAAIANEVHVLGLTPHSSRAAEGPDMSAVWRIVAEWESGADDDGVAFREKVYGVFPGFEPNVNDGGRGVHFLFLFDPEIGRERYCSLANAVMDGQGVWRDGKLQLTPRNAKGIFETIDRHSTQAASSDSPWNYMVLAPHIQGNHGLLNEVQSQVLENFPCERIAAYELGDFKLPQDYSMDSKPGSFLLPFMEANNQAFCHNSDAYTVERIGERHTWLKLASPTIEALRQAFIASESRVRIGFERDESGELRPLAKPPDITTSDRPWLRSVTVHGSASFFGAEGEEAVFEFSPDLTCIIGGSMTGKSTLLDGLRVHVDAPLPDDKGLLKQVEERGRQGFLAGSAEVSLDCPGQDRTSPLHERWPAVFYTQNELQRLADQPDSVEDILARLVPGEAQSIQEREQRLRSMDDEAKRLAQQLNRLDEEQAEAQQAFERAQGAQKELEAFSEAGVEDLHAVSRRRQQWQEALRGGEAVQGKLGSLAEEARGLELPETDEALVRHLQEQAADLQESGRRWQAIQHSLDALRQELEAWRQGAGNIVQALEAREKELRTSVERALAEQGHNASRIQEFTSLNRQASLLESYRDNLQKVQQKRNKAEESFRSLLAERQEVVREQREAFAGVMERIATEFEGRIRARRIENGRSEPLDRFLQGLKQRGISRWWNGLAEEARPSPDGLVRALAEDRLADWGMSPSVQESFREQMTPGKKRELEALRNPDRYVLEHQVEGSEGEYRSLEMLSGGRRVSVLLSLLLRTADERPLVIDQPEDQLDNRFLFEDVLPALRSLKGQRQIIVATHNANIVVNGDADQVIQLEASGSHGRVACAGAIEEPKVRDAIVRTVDGGDEAFRLRRLKYGF